MGLTLDSVQLFCAYRHKALKHMKVIPGLKLNLVLSKTDLYFLPKVTSKF